MNGLQRYNELEAALRMVEKVKLGLYRETNFMVTPALEKVMRVGNYLMKQAGNVMEGLTEDGWEEGDERAGRVLLRSMGCESYMDVPAGDVGTVVDMVFWMSRDGYSQDVAEDIEERMERTKCSLSGLSGEQERAAVPAGWASVEGGAAADINFDDIPVRPYEGGVR